MSRITSSFSGKILEIPALCVDNFENPDEDGARAYFLSHYHADHIVGLNTPKLLHKLESKHDIFIYATKLTSAIITHNNEHLKDYVRVLELGENIISVPGNQRDPELILTVTLIPAGHCLGSTMFLFRTTSLNILYTGDFRIRTNDLPKYKAFHDENGDVIRVDTLYVDTTFLNEWENFPKRSDSVEEAMNLIRGYLDSNKNQFVILKTPAYYGYEYIFNEVFKLLGNKVYVDDKRWAFYCKIQNLVEGVTNDPTKTRVFLDNIPDSRRSLVPPKIIKYTAMRWSSWNEDMSAVKEDGDKIYVCFSTHCSSSEVKSFVEYLDPKSVVGFPQEYEVKASPIKKDKTKFVLSINSPKKRPLMLNITQSKYKKVDAAVLKDITG